MTLLSRKSVIGLAKETTQGTPVAPTAFLPISAPKPEDLVPPLRDESIRGNDSVLQGIVAGPTSSTFDYQGDVYLDVFPHHLAAILGPDTVTGAADPYTHTFKQSTAALPSYTITDDNVSETRAYPGCFLAELSIKIDATTKVSYDAKWVGWPSASATTPTPTWTTQGLLAGWQWSLTCSGAASTRGISAEMTFKRTCDVIHSSDGQQGPREVFPGPIEFDYKLKAIFEGDTDFTPFLSYTVNPWVATVTQSANRSLAITSSQNNFTKATLDRSGVYASLDLEGSGFYNATDGGVAQAVVKNAQTTAY